ncbi:unnamed protein product [Lactuca saligna]|uniref:Uncharacterized protein n=1 Tax=Lactuca saligna TaxID=75948 RepID=A0AA35ZJZ7_LACSI|nr:unnamed protein product [Lactuca saligna]
MKLENRRLKTKLIRNRSIGSLKTKLIRNPSMESSPIAEREEEKQRFFFLCDLPRGKQNEIEGIQGFDGRNREEGGTFGGRRDRRGRGMEKGMWSESGFRLEARSYRCFSGIRFNGRRSEGYNGGCSGSFVIVSSFLNRKHTQRRRNYSRTEHGKDEEIDGGVWVFCDMEEQGRRRGKHVSFECPIVQNKT